jgi:uncharacterized membrane protein
MRGDFMTKDMFINDLRRALAVGLSSTEIEVHAKYYNEYIAMELSKGKTEEQILEELGDPRLISKSILEAKEDGEKQTKAGQKAVTREKKLGKMPNWLLAAVIIIVIICIIVLAFRLFIYLLPVLIIVGIVLMVIAFIRKIF